MKNSLILSSKVLNKKYVAKFFIGAAVIALFSIMFFLLYFNFSFPKYVEFSEDGKIDYKVYLEKNDFFVSKYLGKDRQYIAELINYIIADFEYSISLNDDDISYKYDYRVDIEADVIDKDTQNIIFNKKKEVINKQDLVSSDGIFISENIKVDYSYYNNLVKELINTYGLRDNTKATLTARLYVTYDCEFDELKNNVKNDVVLTMEMPLSERTVGVSLDNDIFSLNNDFFIFKSDGNYIILLFIAIILGVLALYLAFRLIRYLIDINCYVSETDKKLSKILKNYESYIQRAKGSFDFRNYRVLIVNEFESLLELRDMLSKPIMMIEDEVEGIIRFVITTNDIAYVYQLMK